MNRKLGRLHIPDPRDKRYALPIPVKRSKAVRRTWLAGPAAPWDQGQTSQCVAYGVNGYLAASPIRNAIPHKGIAIEGVATKTRADWLARFYKAAQRLDDIPGEGYDGTTVRAGFKLARELGFVSGFNWATEVETCVDYVLDVGPMVVGTDWTRDMFDVRPGGFIRLGSDYDVSGGHCYILIGADRSKRCPDKSVGAFRILNSWGRAWGESGRAWISFAEFATLLRNNGEAAVASEVLI